VAIFRKFELTVPLSYEWKMDSHIGKLLRGRQQASPDRLGGRHRFAEISDVVLTVPSAIPGASATSGTQPTFDQGEQQRSASRWASRVSLLEGLIARNSADKNRATAAQAIAASCRSSQWALKW
jgi:hypothetical protein